jgi:hypothetical protein
LEPAYLTLQKLCLIEQDFQRHNNRTYKNLITVNDRNWSFACDIMTGNRRSVGGPKVLDKNSTFNRLQPRMPSSSLPSNTYSAKALEGVCVAGFELNTAFFDTSDRPAFVTDRTSDTASIA